jgi:hypothetical protein
MWDEQLARLRAMCDAQPNLRLLAGGWREEGF